MLTILKFWFFTNFLKRILVKSKKQKGSKDKTERISTQCTLDLENLSFLITADKSRPQSVILRAKNGLRKIKPDRWNFSSGTLAQSMHQRTMLVLHSLVQQRLVTGTRVIWICLTYLLYVRFRLRLEFQS